MLVHPGAWWLEADERAARNALSVIRLRSHLVRLRSREVVGRAKELGASSKTTLASVRSLVRRSKWLIATGHPLPRVIRGGRPGGP